MTRVSLAKMPVAVAWTLMSWSHMELARTSVVRTLALRALHALLQKLLLSAILD